MAVHTIIAVSSSWMASSSDLARPTVTGLEKALESSLMYGRAKHGVSLQSPIIGIRARKWGADGSGDKDYVKVLDNTGKLDRDLRRILKEIKGGNTYEVLVDFASNCVEHPVLTISFMRRFIHS